MSRLRNLWRQDGEDCRDGGSASMESQADPALAWTVQATPEYICHKVNHFYTFDDIRAVITINYWGTQW